MDSLEIGCNEKSPPGGNALRRQGIMSLKRPAAGIEKESRLRDSFSMPAA